VTSVWLFLLCFLIPYCLTTTVLNNYNFSVQTYSRHTEHAYSKLHATIKH
jgi:hypothetical protein